MAFPCPKCAHYLYGWSSHDANFPYEDWIIIEKHDIQVGTHASFEAMYGTAKCKACNYIMNFSCAYGPGYTFTDPNTPFA